MRRPRRVHFLKPLQNFDDGGDRTAECDAMLVVPMLMHSAGMSPVCILTEHGL
jgi:hypothetical protein